MVVKYVAIFLIGIFGAASAIADNVTEEYEDDKVYEYCENNAQTAEEFDKCLNDKYSAPIQPEEQDDYHEADET